MNALKTIFAVVLSAFVFNAYADLNSLFESDRKNASGTQTLETKTLGKQELEKAREVSDSVSMPASVIGGAAAGLGKKMLEGASSGGFVIVEVQCTGGLWGCTAKNLSISGGPGNFSPSHKGAYSGGIHRGYNGELAGQYRYSAQIESRICSGSFSISGQKQNVIIDLYKDCNVSYINEF